VWRTYKNYFLYSTSNAQECYYENTVYGDVVPQIPGVIQPIPGPDIAAIGDQFVVSQTQYNYWAQYLPMISGGSSEPGFRNVCEIINSNCPVGSYEVSKHGAGYEDYPWSWGSSVTAFKNGSSVIPYEVGFGFHKPNNTNNSYGNWFGNVPHVKHSTINGTFVVSRVKIPKQNIAFEENMSIYPVPAFDHIFISGPVNQGDLITINDISGRLVLQEKFSGRLIPINTLAAGTYLLTVRGPNRKQFSRLFVKASK
jgi:hypothetical protein